MIADLIVTIALLTVMAGISIFGISAVMKPFTIYDFSALGETSEEILLQMYVMLKHTRMAIVAVLIISIVIKSFLFTKAKNK